MQPPSYREQFAAALRKGQGRARLHVQQYGLEGVDDLVLDACLHNQVFDQQIEAGRGDWLFGMFSETPFLPGFRQAILAALETEHATWDMLQLARLAREMAERGDSEARQRLHSFVVSHAHTPGEDAWLGVEDWLDLEGPQGMLELARIYGQRLQENPDDFVYDNGLLSERGPAFRSALEQAALQDGYIKIYLDYLLERESIYAAREPVDREKIRQVRRQQVRQEHTLESILQDAQNKVGRYPGRYAIFGRYAEQEELDLIYAHLQSEMDEGMLIRLLSVFRGAKLPQFARRIYQWADGETQNSDLQSAALYALAQMRDERVHQLARQKVETGSLLGANQNALDLFTRNYDASDAVRIAASLARLKPSIEDAHSLGYSIRGLVGAHKDPALADALLWAYENTPCGFCRYQIVESLHEFGRLPPEIAAECAFDAEDDLRAFIHKISSPE